MHKQRFSLVFVILLVVVYAVIFYLQKGNSSPEVVEIYFADRITAAHKELIDKYNEMKKGKVKVVTIDFPNVDFSTNERKEVLARSLRGTGDGIDLFAVDIVWVQRFAKWCEPLDKYFTDKEKKRILPQAIASCYSQGELVAIPLDFVLGIMYYRDDLLKKLKNGNDIIKQIQNGITWEDLIKLKSQLNVKNPFYIFPAADYEGLICCYMEMLLGLKGDYFRRYGFNFNKPEAAEALQMMVDFVNKFNMTPDEVTKLTEVPSYQYYIQNDGLFLHGWPSYDKDFKDSPVDSLKEKYLRKAPLPYFNNGKPAATIGGWHLMISKFSNKKKEVIDFVKFLLSDSSQEMFYRVSGYYPVINKFFEDSSYVKKYPEIVGMRKFIKYGVHRPSYEEYTRYSKILSFYVNQAIKKQISVKDALAKTTSAIQLERTIVKDF